MTYGLLIWIRFDQLKYEAYLEYYNAERWSKFMGRQFIGMHCSSFLNKGNMRTSLHQMIFEKVYIIQILCLEYLFNLLLM